ncbi:uncharacterized protein KGF55_003868 [Candida pseudojiufengensis]|uniref:uncharacterized protein n=1 Tax=Candida pseudojiufengensis TaxID=497109 RepID=UPI0022245206|nr:uncharacterized protein KGF55_003868 [Candida pseudojiufengensis]KAI5961897.1 hypothetical protein KGF55_003868 [Candida pseudojiufengensis]
MEFHEIPTINDTTVSSEDEVVRSRLQKLGQPVFINGETVEDRKQRLHSLLNDDAIEEDQNGEEEDDEFDEDEDEDEEFYTPASEELYDIRRHVLSDSLQKSSDRLKIQRQIVQNNPDYTTFLKQRRDLNSKISKIDLYGSQFLPGNTRAISSVKFNRNGKLIACGSWDGSLHILESNNLSPIIKPSQNQHQEKIGSLDWKMNEDVLISGGGEGTINLWNIEENSTETVLKPKFTIKDAHTNRITKTEFHPINQYAISTSFDQTWKLWDLIKQVEIYQQEGHSKEVFCGSIHPDGSLYLSGGLDGIIYVWDLRSGKCLMPLQKHIQGIYGLDWSPNGYNFASGSGDSTIKIWDMRKLNHSGDEISTIPAHKKLISGLKYYKSDDEKSGNILMSSSYDGTINLWSVNNWIKVNTLQGTNDKVMSCDITTIDNEITVVGSGWDRTVKLWK